MPQPAVRPARRWRPSLTHPAARPVAAESGDGMRRHAVDALVAPFVAGAIGERPHAQRVGLHPPLPFQAQPRILQAANALHVASHFRRVVLTLAGVDAKRVQRLAQIDRVAAKEQCGLGRQVDDAVREILLDVGGDSAEDRERVGGGDGVEQ